MREIQAFLDVKCTASSFKYPTCEVLISNEYYCCADRRKFSIFLDTLGVGGRILLKWLLKERDGTVWTRLIVLRLGTNEGLL
jgi:hypothetical protein